MRQIRLAFAGLRHVHITALYRMAVESDNAEIAAVCEEDGQAAAEAERAWGIRTDCLSYDKIISDPSVDAVAIGDYYGRRGSMVIKALQSGKHVFCDKPLCTSMDELRTIRALSSERGLRVCLMLDLRYMGAAMKARELVLGGELGDIHGAVVTGQHYLNIPERPKWYFEPGRHGGTINDIAIHGIDLLRYITGKELSSITCAREWNAFAKDYPDFRDSAQFMLDMQGMGVVGDVSYSAPPFGGILPSYWRFELYGDKGMLSFHYAEPNVLMIYGAEERQIVVPEQRYNLIDEFVKEISLESSVLSAVDCLQSQEETLLIQRAAV